jgi:hypothetical protein
MDATEAHARSGALDGLLAGLSAGMFGALAMLAWLGVASVYYRRSFWAVPNLLASTFHGEGALRWGFASTTPVGVAIFLLIYSALGSLFGLIAQDRTTPARTALIGMIVALGWYYVSFGPLWTAINPLVPLYVQDRPLLAGHLIYGGLLGRMPSYLRRLRSAS